MSSKNQSPVSLQQDALAELTDRVSQLFDVRDRRYGFPARTYERCFIGSEAVAAMVAHGLATDAMDAVRIGNLLLQAGIFRHVLNEHAFKDEFLFYRFAADADHGEVARNPDGSDVSWADLDFLGATTGGFNAGELQARMPERDPQLASFVQDRVDTIDVSPRDEHNIVLLDHTRPRAWIDPQPKARYNLVIIGAGSGGLVSAAGAAGLGAEVALIESHLLGGDCLTVGCVPSKALLACAKAAAAARNAAEFGVSVGEVRVDFGAVMQRMRKLRAQIAPHDSAQRFSQDLGVDVFLGRARFTGRDSVEVNGKTLKFAKAIVATGATAAIPPIPGLERVPYLTNASVFNLTELPRRLAVIGAGPIGMELAQAFQRFGAAVTVLFRGQPLPKEDAEAAQVVTASLVSDGVTMRQVKGYRSISGGHDGAPIRIELDLPGDEGMLEVDAILIAAGRKPTLAGLGLEEAGVDFDARSGIKVNERLQTSNPDIFAVGDVASPYQFTHMSDFMARLAIRNALFFGRDKHTQLLVPWATYTDPEVAHVGLYPRDLEERGLAFATFERHFKDVDRTLLESENAGFVKIHVAQGSDQILGATIVGSHAGDMISEVCVAMQASMGLGRLASVIHPYPTAAEAIRQCGDAYNRTRLTPTVRKLFNRLMQLQR
jgi:pyruvate/2-oxoglutarate dehydrogenase complex dihydrolipoamide dehydrogenase (E3) component